MQKMAQRRSILNKLHEATNIGGIAAENFFDPEFKEIMDKLRTETDDPIRAIVSGEKIGDYSPADKLSLRDILKSARSNFNTKEYMKCVADLGRFHKRVADIVSKIKAFDYNLDKIHHRFLFDELKPESAGYNKEYAEYLQDLKQRFTVPSDKKANYNINMLVVNAGIIDFFKNIGTDRGRALSAWEKRYPNRVKELKTATLRLLDQSDKLLDGIISILKVMATSRATRKVDDYVKQAHRIVMAYKTYDDYFKSYYDSQVKKFLETQELLSPSKSVKTPEEIGNQNIGNPKNEPALENVTTTTQQAILSDPVVQKTMPQISQPTVSAPIVDIPLEEPKVTTPIEQSPVEVVQTPVQVETVQTPVSTESVTVETPPQPQSDTDIPPQPKRRGKVNQPGPKATQLGAGALQRARESQQKAIRIDNRTPEQLEAARLEAERVAAIKSAPSPLLEKQKRDLAMLREQKAREAAEKNKPTTQLTEEQQLAELLREIPDKQSSSNHNKFINSLESLSGEHPIILSKFILKYAHSIKISDPITYTKLINIVNSIKV